MSNNINSESSRRIFLRMRDDGSKVTAICDVLCEVNPNADEDAVFLFVAECIKTLGSKEKKTTRKSQATKRESESYSSGGCGGSVSSSPHC